MTKPAESGPSSERLTITLFEADTAALKRIRNGIFADLEHVANNSEIIRFLLRTAPAKINAKQFLKCLTEMDAEDGRTNRKTAAGK